MEVSVGQVVRSKAGRDKGKRFIVLDLIEDKYVFISDGSLRKVKKPKKKKLKHIELTEVIIYDISEKIMNNVKLEDAEIRKHLKAQYN